MAPTLSTYSTAPITMEGSSLSGQLQNQKLKRQIEPKIDRFEDTQGAALTQLRYAASDGDFDLAWSIFRNNFDLQSLSSRHAMRSSSPSKKDRLVDEKNVRSAKTEGAIHVKSLREQRKEVKRELTELDEAVTLQGIGIDMGTEGIKPADVSMDEAHKLAVSFNLEL